MLYCFTSSASTYENKIFLFPSSQPITSWEIDGETVETVSDFIFGGSKITADGDFMDII